MKIPLPVTGIAAVVVSAIELVGATLFVQGAPNGLLGGVGAIVAGIALALPVYYGVTKWAVNQIAKISDKTDERHEDNQKSDKQMQETMGTMAETLRHLSQIIEGQEGLMKDRAINRKRRHAAGTDLMILFFKVAWIERWNTEMGEIEGHPAYQPAPDPPRNRRDESAGSE